MKPYYEHDGITIYHGDCREVVRSLSGFHAMVTDPPYGMVNKFGIQDRGPGKGIRRLEFDWDTPDITVCVIESILATMDAVIERGAAWCFCGGDQFGLVQEVFRSSQMVAKPAIWIKQCPPPAGKGNWWPSGFEFAVYGYRPGAWFGDSNKKRSNVFTFDSYRHGQPGKVDHPTQKPLKLMSLIVESVVPVGGKVIDPFMGSGTTLVAAKMCGRRAVGIEIEERYCEIAANRLRQGVFQFTEEK